MALFTDVNFCCRLGSFARRLWQWSALHYGRVGAIADLPGAGLHCFYSAATTPTTW